MDVHRKDRYILALEKGRGKGDDRGVAAAQKLFHDEGHSRQGMALSRRSGTHLAGEVMGLDEHSVKPHERLADWLAEDMAAVNVLIRDRMASEHAPRIPEVTAHLVGAGGKRLRPMLTLAAARLCGYDGPFHVHLAATVEFIHTATLLHDDVVDVDRKQDKACIEGYVDV